MPRVSHSFRAAWGTVPDLHLDKATGQGDDLSGYVPFSGRVMPFLRRLADSTCQLVFAEGGSAATAQGADPGLALCSSFLDGGQGME